MSCVRHLCSSPLFFFQKTEASDRQKAPKTLESAFLGPFPKTPAGKRGLRLDTTAASDLGDIRESDMFEQVTTPDASPKSDVSEQASTPEASPESPNYLTVTEKVACVTE